MEPTKPLQNPTTMSPLRYHENFPILQLIGTECRIAFQKLHVLVSELNIIPQLMEVTYSLRTDMWISHKELVVETVTKELAFLLPII
jgi:hypothetical protein